MDSIKYSAMSITEMFDKAFYVHKNNIGTSALYMLVANIISVAIGLLVGFISIIPLSLVMINNEMLGYGIVETGIYVRFAIIFFLFMLLMLSLQYISQSGVILIGSNGFLKQKTDIGKALEGMFKNIPRVLSVILAGALLFAPITAVIVGILIALISNYQLTQFIPELGGTFYIIGIILCIVAFVIWYVFFMTIHAFSIHVAVLEKLTFFKALKRSRELIKGRFWRTLGSVILFSLVVAAISYSIYLILGFIVGIIFLLIGSSGIDESLLVTMSMISNLLMYPVQIVVALFIGPISGIFLTIFYYNQRFKKDAYDIELNLTQLKNVSRQ